MMGSNVNSTINVPKALWVKHVNLPSEVEKQFLETLRQEHSVLVPSPLSHLVDPITDQCVYGRVDITECKLVGRDLPVWGHVGLAQEQQQLMFSELEVNSGERIHVESQIPRRVLKNNNKQTHRINTCSPIFEQCMI